MNRILKEIFKEILESRSRDYDELRYLYLSEFELQELNKSSLESDSLRTVGYGDTRSGYKILKPEMIKVEKWFQRCKNYC